MRTPSSLQPPLNRAQTRSAPPILHSKSVASPRVQGTDATLTPQEEDWFARTALDRLGDVISEEEEQGAMQRFAQEAHLPVQGPGRRLLKMTDIAPMLATIAAHWPRRAPYIASEAGLRWAAELLRRPQPRHRTILFAVLPTALSAALLARLLAAEPWAKALSSALTPGVGLTPALRFTPTSDTRGPMLGHWLSGALETYFTTLIHKGYRGTMAPVAPGATGWEFKFFKD